ncbi:peptide chain release factor N(5)-glutamine methyltransferase [Acinetobacter sp. ANC 4648]|uniref:peptide chain release factor N(5)-glutamine methyltransferase n=1 Tax=Acinetobacter sp. ANC 4648 TaxID=1977875 RepID=UPI000A341D78|nr:peptide chain release factor N(5)-glutamine methyltransferase [Acinetobacter sp. ANC 4648]OTG83048.1 protein-(glutamine-N5) methyltransferase, release factor-specific [Acinetobacter sp. ANC 4648]
MNIAQALALRGEAESYERQENAWLLEYITKIDSFDLVMKKAQELTAEQEQSYVAGLARIAAGEPLAYVTGSQPFWTLDLKVTQDTLVPRPDTEVLVETVLHLELPEDARVVDLGTGTGAIALSLASERANWAVSATDIYEPTLEVAVFNAEKHDLPQVKFFLGNWFKALSRQYFDVIVSNPPYIDADDEHMPNLASEPERALVAQKQGLSDIEHIVQQGKKWLAAEGWIVLEHGYDQADAVQKIFKDAGFRQVRTVKDYGGNDRVTLGQWLN